MPMPYSSDLRTRVIEDVITGTSRREAAEHYRISPSVVVIWAQRFEATGSVAAKPSGGSISPLERHAKILIALIAVDRDMTRAGAFFQTQRAQHIGQSLRVDHPHSFRQRRMTRRCSADKAEGRLLPPA